MESSIAVFLTRQQAYELLPTIMERSVMMWRALRPMLWVASRWGRHEHVYVEVWFGEKRCNTSPAIKACALNAPTLFFCSLLTQKK